MTVETDINAAAIESEAAKPAAAKVTAKQPVKKPVQRKPAAKAKAAEDKIIPTQDDSHIAERIKGFPSRRVWPD